MNTVVGAKIKRLRKEKGLSQEQVADHLHVSQSTYARIESGESSSWASYIEPISELFEIQPEELIKQESVIINHDQKGGGGYIQINQLSEKLMEQFELRIADKERMIKLLQETNASLLALVETLKG
ncbi:MAG: helix-turn-helix domain-containing protein [Flavobacteriaceae bacterium]|nr:helix-turn-helix domain-containing protein [Flavobacteriaceae bacterium]